MPYFQAPLKHHHQTSSSTTGVVITMEDILLHVVLDDPNDQIKQVSIKTLEGKLVRQLYGCLNSNCSYNVNLVPAAYVVTVISQQCTFDHIVEKY